MADTDPIGLAARAKRRLSWHIGRAVAPLAPAARRATARARVRPTFLVIGAQKGGTTALYRYLREHPAAFCATPKEVHYFNVEYHRGPGWYLAHFPLATRGAAVRRRLGVRPAVGEVTPAYLFHPRVPEQVHAFDPELKLVAALRDPVERAYSQYQMQLRGGTETRSFEYALEREEEEWPRELERLLADPAYVSPTGLQRSYVARGRYAEQLERWLRFFPREQLLILTSEDLLGDPAGPMAAVAAFLGIPAWQAETYPLRSVNEYGPMAPEVRDRLARTFEPHNRRLEELLGRRLPWTRAAVAAPVLESGPRTS